MSKSLGLSLSIGAKRSYPIENFDFFLNNLISASTIDAMTMSIVDTASDSFTGANNSALNSVLWPIEYEHGADINTSSSKVDIQSNAAHFTITHTGSQTNLIGINIISLATIDLSGAKQYRVTTKIKHQAAAGMIAGVTITPASGAGAWNILSDAVNAPDMFGCYTAATGSSFVTRYRRDGVVDVGDTKVITAVDTNYHTFVLTVSATAIETKYDGVVQYSGNITNALDNNTKVALVSMTNGTSVSGVADFDDFMIERLQ